MKRSSEFDATVKHGVRAVQPDIVVHARRIPEPATTPASAGPQFGLVISKAVGSSVQRHRVARRLRHIARAVIEELQPEDRVVIRALPSSRQAMTVGLEKQLRKGLAKAELLSGMGR
jgi:ribonuclease P protein component